MLFITPYLHPVAIHIMEKNTERVRLGCHVAVQQVGATDGELYLCDAVLGPNGRTRVGAGGQSIGHGDGSTSSPAPWGQPNSISLLSIILNSFSNQIFSQIIMLI